MTGGNGGYSDPADLFERGAERVKILVIGTGKVGSLLIEQLAQEGHDRSDRQ